MSLADLKHEVERLLPEDRRHLLAFLITLEGRNDATQRAELERKIDDRDPEHWITLSEARLRLADT